MTEESVSFGRDRFNQFNPNTVEQKNAGTESAGDECVWTKEEISGWKKNIVRLELSSGTVGDKSLNRNKNMAGICNKSQDDKMCGVRSDKCLYSCAKKKMASSAKSGIPNKIFSSGSQLHFKLSNTPFCGLAIKLEKGS